MLQLSILTGTGKALTRWPFKVRFYFTDIFEFLTIENRAQNGENTGVRKEQVLSCNTLKV